MKSLIKKLLREGLSEAGINLGLSKQIRSAQKDIGVDDELDSIFGKNVYRLYYDLDTGKQITPTKKDPKLKFDVNIKDRLDQTINQTLNNHDFEVTDLEKNIATNTRNNQQTKISKVLGSLDNELKNEYTTYLDSLTRQNQETDKLYAVISRHSHDIASMSTKPNLSSCESLEGLTDINQTQIPTAMGGSEDAAEGGGQYIWNEIANTSIITYLIKEGDWNLEDPLGRILGTNLCLTHSNRPKVYGKYETRFKNFWVEWVGYYRSKILKQNELEFDEDTFKKSSDELIKIIDSFGRENPRQTKYMLRGVVNNRRFDVLHTLFNEKFVGSEVKIHGHKVDWYLKSLNDMFQPKVFKAFPPEVQAPIKEYIDKELDNQIKTLKRTYLFITDKESREKMVDFINTNQPTADYSNKFIMLGLKEPNSNGLEYGNIMKAYSGEKLNILKKINTTIENADLESLLQ